ncbi:MAG: helix-turn-helix transcriptional regulator [Cyanobacteriota bacterium]|nr:helix-turn-helix transcriptional regulator [Cyanobacteriota bacterium]
MSSNKDKAVKNRLKELQKRYQWSQSDLARELGVSRQAVNGFESGKFSPSLEMALKIASLFDRVEVNVAGVEFHPDAYLPQMLPIFFLT